MKNHLSAIWSKAVALRLGGRSFGLCACLAVVPVTELHAVPQEGMGDPRELVQGKSRSETIHTGEGRKFNNTSEIFRARRPIEVDISSSFENGFLLNQEAAKSRIIEAGRASPGRLITIVVRPEFMRFESLPASVRAELTVRRGRNVGAAVNRLLALQLNSLIKALKSAGFENAVAIQGLPFSGEDAQTANEIFDSVLAQVDALVLAPPQSTRDTERNFAQRASELTQRTNLAVFFHE